MIPETKVEISVVHKNNNIFSYSVIKHTHYRKFVVKHRIFGTVIQYNNKI